jgi:hypothetical protein
MQDLLQFQLSIWLDKQNVIKMSFISRKIIKWLQSHFEGIFTSSLLAVNFEQHSCLRHF